MNDLFLTLDQLNKIIEIVGSGLAGSEVNIYTPDLYAATLYTLSGQTMLIDDRYILELDEELDPQEVWTTCKVTTRGPFK